MSSFSNATFDDEARLTDSGASTALQLPTGWLESCLMTAGTLDEALTLAAAMRLQRIEDGQFVVEEADLVSDNVLIEAIGATASQTATAKILRALNRSVRRGALVRTWVGDGDVQRTRYVLPARHLEDNQPESSDSEPADPHQSGATQRYDPVAPSVFAAYENAIGMLTPLVADQIQHALERYPAEQILDAIREAVSSNRRSWRYIQRVLQNWAGSGRELPPAIEVNHETNQRSAPEPLDPDKYRGDRHLERARKLQVRDL